MKHTPGTTGRDMRRSLSFLFATRFGFKRFRAMEILLISLQTPRSSGQRTRRKSFCSKSEKEISAEESWTRRIRFSQTCNKQKSTRKTRNLSPVSFSHPQETATTPLPLAWLATGTVTRCGVELLALRCSHRTDSRMGKSVHWSRTFFSYRYKAGDLAICFLSSRFLHNFCLSWDTMNETK